MVVLASHLIKISYHGGVADENELPLYDGTASIHGVAQSLQIATHAYLNEEIVGRATALHGASFLIRPPRRGSFIMEVVANIEKFPACSTAVTAIAAPAFYDFLKIAYQKALGAFVDEPETPTVRRMFERDEPFFDELGETLEGSLARAHRPIGDEVDYVTISRPRADLVTLDQDTKEWVNTRDVGDEFEEMTGNVTRFNSVTRNGRAYIDQLNKIVPFKPDGDFNMGRIGGLTWSLHGSNVALPNKLKFSARRVCSASGQAKRLLLRDCSRVEE